MRDQREHPAFLSVQSGGATLAPVGVIMRLKTFAKREDVQTGATVVFLIVGSLAAFCGTLVGIAGASLAEAVFNGDEDSWFAAMALVFGGVPLLVITLACLLVSTLSLLHAWRGYGRFDGRWRWVGVLWAAPLVAVALPIVLTYM